MPMHDKNRFLVVRRLLLTANINESSTTTSPTNTRCRPNGTLDVTLLARRGVSAARPPALLQTTTDDNEQNNTGSSGGPVITDR